MKQTLTAQQRELVEQNLRLVPYVIKKMGLYSDNRMDTYQDLIQIGNLGLIRAACKYNPARGAFSTIAVVEIQGEFFRYFRSKKSNKRKANEGALSLDAPVRGGKNAIYAQLLPDEKRPLEEAVMDHLLCERVISYAEESGNQNLLLLLTKQATQQEIARRMNLSQAQVSRMTAAFRLNTANELEV